MSVATACYADWCPKKPLDRTLDPALLVNLRV